MQTACVEFAATFVDWRGKLQRVRSATPHRVIYKLRELRGVEELGGTMRLGAWPCKIEPGTLPTKSTARPRSASGTASLRIQPRVRKHTDGGWPADLWIDAGRHLVEMWRFPASLFHRLPIPSGVQVEAARAHPLFRHVIGAAHAHCGQRRARSGQRKSNCSTVRRKWESGSPAALRVSSFSGARDAESRDRSVT